VNGFKDFIDNSGRLPTDNAERRAIIQAACHSGLVVLVVGAAFTTLVQNPADVTLTRVQASLLPDIEETIVPFDQTFCEKVVPEVIGGS
jgi:hypothetical protein